MTIGTGNEASLTAITARATDIGVKIGEMMAASAVVVTARVALMGAAMLNPADGDYREMRRMLPEKMFALSHSGIALFEGMATLQRDLAAQAGDMVALATGGVATPRRLAKLADDAGARGARALLWPIAASGAAMAPVHRTVTSNARRLASSAG